MGNHSLLASDRPNQVRSTYMKNPLYLVIFYGIPDWKGESLTSPCSRRYLFSSQGEADAFVRRRTQAPGWFTHSAYPKDSMMCRLKRGSTNRYQIVTVYVDDVYDEDLSNESVQQSKS